MTKNSTIREVEKLEAAMEANPPVIVWRPNGRGVMVALSVDDPYRSTARSDTKDVCKRGHPFTEENTIVRRDGRQCRTCKNGFRKQPTTEQKNRRADRQRMRRRLKRGENAA